MCSRDGCRESLRGSFAKNFAPEAKSSHRAATQLATRPQPRLHGCLRGGSFVAADRRGGPATLMHGHQVQDRNGPLAWHVLQTQLCASRLASRLELDGRTRALVVVVHPCLQHVHRVLLGTRFTHTLSYSFYSRGAKRSRIMSARPASSSCARGRPALSRSISCGRYAGSQAG